MIPRRKCNSSKVFFYLSILTALLSHARSVCASETAHAGECASFSLLPEKYSAALGYGLSRRPLFGQESVYRESVYASAAAHWSCLFMENCTFLARAGYLAFLGIPRHESAVSVEQNERRFSVGVGIESTAIVPIGASLGMSEVVRSYQYSLGSKLISESGVGEWRESSSKTVLDVWLGVPLLPEFATLNVTLSRFLEAKSPEDNSVYGVELRFEH